MTISTRPAWLTEFLACPRHRGPLSTDEHGLCCAQGCHYPLVHGIPVLLPPESVDFPHEVLAKTLTAVDDGSAWSEFGGIQPPPAGDVDAWVAEMIGATNSNLYRHLVGKLHAYPIPDPPFTSPVDAPALDIGCGWGRWSLSLARTGQRVIGIDPSLPSVLAATRVAHQLGLAEQLAFVVADARTLPFKADSLGRAFSYSVLQHFPKDAVRQTLNELQRVLINGADTRLHLLNGYGLRSIQVQFARGFRVARDFEVRYWRPAEMLAQFRTALGPSHLDVDGFLVQARPEDRELLTPGGRRLLNISQTLKRACRAVPLLTRLADNLFVVSRVQKG